MAGEYQHLERVLQAALEQASQGKGKERHALAGEAFEDQQIVQLGEWLGTNHFQLGQAVKKILESARLSPERRRVELLGAINYIAAAVIQDERAAVAAPAPDEVRLVCNDESPTGVRCVRAFGHAGRHGVWDYKWPLDRPSVPTDKNGG
jgi:hypothetical protein